VNDLTIGLLSALLATNQPQAVSNLVQDKTGASVAIVNPADPAEKELLQLMDDDDAATAEVNKWISDNDAFAAQGAGESKEELNKRILARFDSIRKGYEDFLRHHPDNASGHLAYGSFLDDTGDEDAAAAQYEKAAQLDPKNPAAWNNLANYYGEHGPLTNAFVDYAKAIALKPNEPVYYQNLATTVYLYRKDAEEFYGITEPEVFDKALALYRKAVQLDPDDFPLATDYAQSYYGIKPLRTNDALVAWTNALQIAHNDTEREGVYIHLARIKTVAGRYDEARAQLDAVTNSAYADLKTRLEKNIAERENAATNPVVATPTNPPPEAPADIAAENTNSISIPTNAIPVSTNEVATTNLPPEVSTNIPAAPENAMVPTNVPPVVTNEIPALTNPPAISTTVAAVLTNVPTPAPESLQMEVPPPDLHPPPQTLPATAP
jgi:Flp pilus assembly protein TadD